MNDNRSDVEAMALAIARAVDAMLQEREMEPMKVLAALGAAGGMLVGLTLPETDDELDGLLMGALGLGFREALESMRRGDAN